MTERWRTGRSVGRTIYRMVGEVASKDDVLIGVMDTPQLAVKVVASVTSCEHVTAERDALKAELATAYLRVNELSKKEDREYRRAEKAVGELAEARAAIERVRMLCTQAQKPDLGSWPMPADVDCDDVLAALDASQRPEDTREEGGDWLKQVADMSLAAARDKFGPGFAPERPEDTRDEYGHLSGCPSGSQFLDDDPACHCARTGVSAETVEDGFGSTWVKCGPDCDLQAVRPGKAQCSCESAGVSAEGDET